MKIKLLCLEDGISNYGFRKFAAFVKQLNEDTRVYFAPLNFNLSVSSMILSRYGSSFPKKMSDEITAEFVNADIIGISSMTPYAPFARQVIESIRLAAPKAFLIWGGTHPIIDPEDAIQAHIDAICCGEGWAFEYFFERFRNGKDFTDTRNFWFKNGEHIIRNGFLPLLSSEALEKLPFPMYCEDEMMFSKKDGLRPLSVLDYVVSDGLSYNIVWSLGCPRRCVYCSNSKFLKNDPNHAITRHTSPAYVIREVQSVRRKHPHISSVSFHDDDFLGLETNQIEEFAESWKRAVGIPFAVLGLSPSNIDEDKLKLLLGAGMNRTRMGIQSGSRGILRFYRRSSSIEAIKKAANILNNLCRNQLPPSYDIIVDNPVETRQDVIDTLELLYELPRPFAINLYSLRVVPNTELEQIFDELGVQAKKIGAYYGQIDNTFSNLLIYLLTFYRPPRWLFERLLRRVKDPRTSQKRFPVLGFVLRCLHLVFRGSYHVRRRDISIIRSPFIYYLWAFGAFTKKLSLFSVRRLEKKASSSVLCSAEDTR